MRAVALPPRKITKSAKVDQGKRSPAHRAWVRGFACCACGSTTGIECAHVRRAANSGVSMKPSDAYTVSLCRDCHAESHQGEATFERKHGVDLMALARKFFEQSPHRHKLDNPWGAR